MKIGTYNQLSIVCLLGLTASISLTGCKVGSWKMPKMSWNREPSATTLAGSETPKLPESPANKYTPSTIASVGAGTSPGTSSGNKVPSYGFAGQTSSTTTPVAAGLAASANGYQTGPYTVGQRPGSTGSQPSSSGTAGNNVAPGPNPYGGSYAGMTPAKSSEATSQYGVKGALANYPAPNASTGYGSAPVASGSAYSGGATALPQIPAAPNANTYGTSTPNTVGTPTQSNPYQNLPPLPSTVAMSAGTVGQTQMPNVPSYPGTSVPTQSTAGQTSVGNYNAGNYNAGSQPSNRYSGVYQPGTTSRSTTYNFGSVAPATATSPSTPGVALPPNTASNPQPNVIR